MFIIVTETILLNLDAAYFYYFIHDSGILEISF